MTPKMVDFLLTRVISDPVYLLSNINGQMIIVFKKKLTRHIFVEFDNASGPYSQNYPLQRINLKLSLKKLANI